MRAQADSPLTLDITVQASGAGGTVDFANITYNDAVQAFVDAEAGTGSAELPVGPAGMPSISVDPAEMHRSDTSLAFLGSTTVLGLQADVLVTAKWDDADTDLAADTAILVSFGSVELGDLTDFDQFPLALTHSWMAIATAEHTVDPGDYDGDVASFFDDGLAGTDDAFDVTCSGVTFRGTLDTNGTVIGEAANAIGLTGEVRLTGTLTTDIGFLGGSGDASAGISLTAEFEIVPGGGSIPDWFEPTANWKLTIEADTGGSISAELSGEANIHIGDQTFAVTASVGFSYDKPSGEATFTFSGEVVPPQDLFGQTWLDLEQVSLTLEYSTADGFSGGLSATLDLTDLTDQAATADVMLSFAAGGDGTEGSIEVTTDASLSLRQLITGFGGPGDAAFDDASFDATVNGFSIYAGFKSSGGSTEVAVSATTNVTFQINDATISSDILFKLNAGGSGGAQFLFALMPDDPSTGVMVGDLLGENLGDLDFELPRFTLTIANEAWDEPADEQDGPTSIYTGGEDLNVESGITLRADVAISGGLKTAIEEIGLDVDGDLVLQGRFDPFTSAGDIDLSLSLPKVSSPPFSDATLSLFLRLSPSSGKVEVGIEGEVTVAVPRTEDTNCPTCTDDLTFDLAATLTVEAGNVKFDLSGGLVVEQGWAEPFGIQGLTIFELRLKVGVQSTPPAVTIGMLGRLNVNGTNVTAAFLFGITPNPPFIDPQGFTFAASNLTLVDLAALHRETSGDGATEQQITDSLPPDLRLEDVFVAFGRVEDPDLCIRPGFFLSAELHSGGTVPDPLPGQGDPDSEEEPPPCETPPVDPPQVTQECQDDPSCLASIRFDIDTGVGTGTPALRAAGFFRGTELGPLTFEPLIIELELSAQTQRFFMSGGAMLKDPIDQNNPDWASGNFTVEFSTDRIFLEANMSLAEGEILQIHVRGEAVLDFSNPIFDLKIEFRSGLLDELANQVEQGFNDLGNFVNDFGTRLSDADSTDATLWRNLQRQLEADGNQPQWLIDVVSTFADIEATLEEINRTFTDAGLSPPFIQQTLEYIVLQGIETPRFPGVELGYVEGTICLVYDPFAGECAVEVVVDPPLCFGIEQGGKCWLIPPTEPIRIGGLCHDPNFNPPEPYKGLLCGNDPSKRELVGDLFADKLQEDLGLQLPEDQSGLEILNTLQTKFDGSGLFATCGYATADYAAETLSDSELTLWVHGEPVVIIAPLNLQGGNFDPNSDLLQLSFDALLEGNAETTFCDETFTAAPEPEQASITLDVTPTTLDEGSAVTASGDVTAAGVATVNISWGDGSNSNATIQADGSYSTTHPYADDIGAESFAIYTVRASAGTAAASQRITVLNVEPTITRLEFDPGSVDEGDTASLELQFSDPGTDSHTVVATWGDGFTQSFTLPTGARSHTITRTIADDNPSITPSDTLGVSVAVSDDDGGSDSAQATLTVNNVAPGGASIEPHQVIVGDGATDGAGNLIVNEGDVVAWQVSFNDPGVRDWHVVTIDWGDGLPAETRVIPASGLATSSFIAVHAFADDPPTGTPTGSYDVTVTIADDDSGQATEVVPVTVNNVAPTIDDLALSTTQLDENEAVVSVALDFSDPGVLDTHTVTIDWGDGWTAGESDDTAVEDEDRDRTVIQVPADVAERSGISATNRYGDNGIYTITVTIVDDDTGEVADTRVLTVNSVNPTHAINDSAADGAITTPAGQQTFIASAGEDLTISDTATDPGSDDLFFDWLYGDGGGVLNTSLAGVPVAGAGDSFPSPQVAPRNVTDEITHAYANACLYGVSVQVTDDDGGDGGTDYVGVVIQAVRAPGDMSQRNHGQWRDAIQEGDISAEQLACYLDIAGYLSSVFYGASELANQPWAPLIGNVDLTVLDENGIPLVLTLEPGAGDTKLESEQIKLDRSLLSAWLNFADGAWEWDTPIEDTNGDGVKETSFGEVMEQVEHVRTTSTDDKEVADARQRLWQLGIR